MSALGHLLWGIGRPLLMLAALAAVVLAMRERKLRRGPERTDVLRRRARASIRAYTGLNGMGKTLCAVRDLQPVLAGIAWHDEVSGRSGERLVWSNVRLLDPVPAGSREEAAAAWAVYGMTPARDPMRLPHPRYRPLTSWAQFFARADDGHWLIEHSSVLLDEVTSVANSRDSGNMAREVADLLVMLRKRDCESVWTGTSFQRADLIIRETTFQVTLCKGSVPEKNPDDPWPPNQRFSFRTYDVSALEEFTQSSADTEGAGKRHKKLRPLLREAYWRPGRIAQQLYDTVDAVTVLSKPHKGRCIHCGGRVKDYVCECDQHHELDAVVQPVEALPLAAAPATGADGPAGARERSEREGRPPYPDPVHHNGRHARL